MRLAAILVLWLLATAFGLFFVYLIDYVLQGGETDPAPFWALTAGCFIATVTLALAARKLHKD